MSGREAAAYRLFEQLRWDGGLPAQCPHCAARGACYYLSPADDRGRATRTGRRSARRVWKCSACRRQFSVLTGTVFERTRIPLAVWADAVGVLAAGPLPEAAELAHRLDVPASTARRVRTRLLAARRAATDRSGRSVTGSAGQLCQG